jgi:hypothetical protein
MALSYTLAQLRSEVRTRGDYENSSVFTDAMLNGYINDGIAEVHDRLIQSGSDYVTLETTLVTTPNQATVSLPANFYKLFGLDQLVSPTIYRRVLRHMLADRNRNQVQTYRDFTYRIQGGNIVLMPVPTSAITLRMVYAPHATKLVLDADVYDGINGYERLVIEKALLYCDQREERPLSDRMARIQQMEGQMLTASDGRDSAEPYYLTDQSQSGDWWP